MAIAHASVGTVGVGSTSVTPGLPASLATGDYVLIQVVTKPDTATIITPANWTLVADVAGGGGTVGNGVGPTKQAFFLRRKDAGWSTMPAISVTGGNSTAAIAARITVAAGRTAVGSASTGVWGTGATTTNASSTHSTSPDFSSGDLVYIGYSTMDEAPTWSAQSISATGATFGAITEASEAVETTTGNDVGGMLAYCTVTAGSSSSAPVTGATLSIAGRGTAAAVRLREVVTSVSGAVDTSFGGTFAASGTITPPPVGSYTLDWSDTNLGGSAVVSYSRGAILDFNDKPVGATAALSITSKQADAVDNNICVFSIETAGSSVMTFDYKVSTEAGYDKLHIDVDGVSQAEYSGVVAWTTHAGISIPSAGVHTIRFRYTKDSGGAANDDRIWIANLNITNTVTVNDDTGGSVDTYDMEDGNIPSIVTTSTWTNSTSGPISGSRSLRSPASPAGNGSYDLVISKGVNEKYRVLAFDYKVDSESGWDKLTIFPDSTAASVPASGNPTGSGAPGWIEYSGSASGHIGVILPPAASTVLLRYAKDGSGDQGADAAWIDNIEMPVAGTGGASGAASGTFGFTSTSFGTPRTPATSEGGYGFVAQAIGKARTLGVSTASFGFVAQGIGKTRKLGILSAQWGGAFTASGTASAPPIPGQATGLFGFSTSISGTPRTLGSATVDFGFTSISGGTPRTFGATATSFGGTYAASGAPRRLGQISSNLGFVSFAESVVRRLGIAEGLFGGSFDASGGEAVPRHMIAYDFNEGTGTVAAEIGGGTSITGIPAWGPGRHGGGSLVVNGVEGPSFTPFTVSSDFTIAFSVKVNGPGGNNFNIILNDYESDGTFGNLQITPSGVLDWYGGAGSVPDYTFPSGQWVDVAVAGNTTTRYIFVDGVLVHSLVMGVDGRSGVGPIELGGLNGYEPNVEYDNLRVFNSVLSESEVALLVNAPVQPNSSLNIQGQVSASFGGSFSASGIPGENGLVTGSFGGTFSASGFPVIRGSASADFGGNLNSTGVIQGSATVVGEFGFSATVLGVRRVDGQVSTSFGGQFIVESPIASNLYSAVSGVWVSTVMRFAINGVWTVGGGGMPPAGVSYGTATTSFGGTFAAEGGAVDNSGPSVASANFGGAFSIAGTYIVIAGAGAMFGGFTGWPMEATTGHSGSLTPNNTDYINVNNTTFDSIDFTYSLDRIQIPGDGNTFINCRFASETVLAEVDGCTFTNCSFDDGMSISSSRNVVIEYCKFVGFTTSDAMHISNDGIAWDNENIVIRHNFVYNAQATGEAHSDGIQVRGSVGLHVHDNFIDMGPYNFTHNSAFYTEGLQGGNIDFIVEDNYFKTGHGYTLYIHSIGDSGIFRNNIIGRGDYGYQYAASPVTISGSGNRDTAGNPYDIHNPPS